VFSHDMQNQGRFGLALVCDEIDPNIGKEVKNDEELENIYVTFLTMGFLKNTLVASGDDGFVIKSLFDRYYSCTFGRMKESLGDYSHMKAQFSQ
jgi:hypothetical protein